MAIRWLNARNRFPHRSPSWSTCLANGVTASRRLGPNRASLRVREDARRRYTSSNGRNYHDAADSTIPDFKPNDHQEYLEHLFQAQELDHLDATPDQIQRHLEEALAENPGSDPILRSGKSREWVRSLSLVDAKTLSARILNLDAIRRNRLRLVSRDESGEKPSTAPAATGHETGEHPDASSKRHVESPSKSDAANVDRDVRRSEAPPAATPLDDVDSEGLRRNAVGVQLLSPSLQRQLFPGKPRQKPSDALTQISLQHLADNDLSPSGAATLPEISFEIPPLQGNNIREHFQRIGQQEAEPYLDLSKRLAESTLPPMPETWCVDQPGWYRYDRLSGKAEPVQDLGEEQLICFDVEVLYKISPYPVMATAATPNAWYSWLSPSIFANDKSPQSGVPSTLIPIATSHPDQPKIIVGHNVGYDRSKVLDEYHVKRTQNRWLDTLALHVSTKGITSVQRPAWMKRKKEKHQAKEHRSQAESLINEFEGSEGDQPDGAFASGKSESWDDADRWEDVTSANALSEVARLHFGFKMDKTVRDEFGNADITSATQLRPNLQNILAYCAKDVEVTHQVLQKVLPLFLLSCPHPVSFAGALTMGNPFLPIDKSWRKYIEDADKKYKELDGGVKGVLWELAYKLKQRGHVEGDPWSEQLDWEPKAARWNDDFVHSSVDGKAREQEADVKVVKHAADEPRPEIDAAKEDEPIEAADETLPEIQDEPLDDTGTYQPLCTRNLLTLRFKCHPIRAG